MRNTGAALLTLVGALIAPSTAQAQTPLGPSWDSVATILQTSGTFAGGYYRYNFPRTDLTVKVGDVTVAPALALGSWAGFSGDGSRAMMMGDLVLTASELAPVQAELARRGLSVTAVHNHLVGEEPRIVYLHYEGEGTATDLARRLSTALAVTATPRPVAAAGARPLSIDTALVFSKLGRGRAQGNLAFLSFVLVPDSVKMHGMTLVPAMAYGTPINIQAVSPTRAVTTGDFAIPAAKVQPVVSALAAGKITATALHSHVVGESPAVYYMHFWGDGALTEIVAALRAALDAAK